MVGHVPHQELDLVPARVLVRRHAQELLPHDGAAGGAQQVRQHRIHARQPLICAKGRVRILTLRHIMQLQASGGA